MIDEEDLHRIAEGAEQQIDIPDGNGCKAAFLHTEKVEPRHGHRHGHPHRPRRLLLEEDAEDGHDNNIEGRQKSRLPGGDGLDAQLLQICPQAHGRAHAQAPQPEIFPVTCPDRKGVLPPPEKTEEPKHPCRDEGPDGVEGEGLQVIRPQALGHKARAPDQRCQHGAAVLLDVSRFHCSCLRLGKMIEWYPPSSGSGK